MVTFSNVCFSFFLSLSISSFIDLASCNPAFLPPKVFDDAPDEDGLGGDRSLSASSLILLGGEVSESGSSLICRGGDRSSSISCLIWNSFSRFLFRVGEMSLSESSLSVLLDGLSFARFRTGELSSLLFGRLGGEASLFELSWRLLGGDSSLSCRFLPGEEVSLFELSWRFFREKFSGETGSSFICNDSCLLPLFAWLDFQPPVVNFSWRMTWRKMNCHCLHYSTKKLIVIGLNSSNFHNKPDNFKLNVIY